MTTYAVNRKTKEHRIEKPGESWAHPWQLLSADKDGWVEWFGGECPLPPNDEAQIDTKIGIKNSGIAGDFRWDKTNRGGDIIAYRPILDADTKLEPPAWNGEGLPPVGCECEILGTQTGSWSVGIIDYIDDKHCIWHWPDGGGETIHNRVYNMQFRPLRSEEDRVVQEMMDAGHGMTRSSIFCRALYRAGYRKHED